MSVRRFSAMAWVLLLALGAAACGSSSSTSTGAGAGGAGSTPAGTSIEIKNFAFAPTPLKAKVGDTITLKNTDSSAHTLTADDDSVDTGNVAAGATVTFKVTKAGTLSYHCHIHDYMKGVIQVAS